MMLSARCDWDSPRLSSRQPPRSKLRRICLMAAVSLALISLHTNLQSTVPSVWAENVGSDFDSPPQYNESAGIREARRLTTDTRSRMKYHFEQLPFHNDKQIKPMSLLHVVPRQGPISLDKNDIVLTTHLSHTKFQNLLLQLQYWNGPASVAVYIKEENEIDMLFDFLEEHEQDVRQASFHIVMEKTSQLQYPFNTLRQAALDGVETDYFLAMDVDLIPLPQNCHGNLTETLARIQVPNKNYHLFVLPAFSIAPFPGEKFASPEMLPSSKQEAKKMVHQNQMIQFHKSSFPQGHGPTQYDTWLQYTNVPRTIPDDPIYEINVTLEESVRYEPYVVGYKPGIPRYWEDFRGFGFDKISFFRECYAAGYRYYVLKDFFCAHLDHPNNLRYQNRMRKKNIPYYRKFDSYLKVEYPETKQQRIRIK